MRASRPGLGCGALLVGKTVSPRALRSCPGALQSGFSPAAAFPWYFLPGAGVCCRTGNSGCTIIAEPIVWGKSRIRSCSHPKTSRCVKRMLQGSQGCRRSSKAQSWFCTGFTLSPDPCVCAQTCCSGFSQESLELRETWSEIGVRTWSLVRVCSFLLPSLLLLVGDVWQMQQVMQNQLVWGI